MKSKIYQEEVCVCSAVCGQKKRFLVRSLPDGGFESSQRNAGHVCPVYDPQQSPSRLEDFLSLCLGEEVEILSALPNESSRLTEEGSLLVMDLLVRLKSGALINVEIQKIGYLFPGQYLHRARQQFDTGLQLDMVQEYLLIPLDIFLESRHNINNRLDAWLMLIASDRPEQILEVIRAYPEFEEIYRQVFGFRHQIKELMIMFSDALKILDANTTKYMIEQQKEKIERLKLLLASKEG